MFNTPPLRNDEVPTISENTKIALATFSFEDSISNMSSGVKGSTCTATGPCWLRRAMNTIYREVSGKISCVLSFCWLTATICHYAPALNFGWQPPPMQRLAPRRRSRLRVFQVSRATTANSPLPTYVLVSLYNISSLRHNRLMQHEQHENIDSAPKPSEVTQTRIIPTTFSPPSCGNNFVSPITPAVNTRNGMAQPLVFICEISITAPKPIIRLLCRQWTCSCLGHNQSATKRQASKTRSARSLPSFLVKECHDWGRWTRRWTAWRLLKECSLRMFTNFSISFFRALFASSHLPRRKCTTAFFE